MCCVPKGTQFEPLFQVSFSYRAHVHFSRPASRGRNGKLTNATFKQRGVLSLRRGGSRLGSLCPNVIEPASPSEIYDFRHHHHQAAVCGHGTQVCCRRKAADKKTKPRRGAEISFGMPWNAAHALYLSKVSWFGSFGWSQHIFNWNSTFIFNI